MKIINITILLMLLLPFVFIMGTVASSAQALGPASAAGVIDLGVVANAGEGMRAATEGMAREEISLIMSLVPGMKQADMFRGKDDLYRIRTLTERGA